MELKKPLGALGVFCIAAGAMISSGLFVLPGVIFVHTGPSIIAAYLLAALAMTPNVLSEIELATAMPKAGGTYFFIERSLGPLAGTFAGLAEWFSTALKGAFALVGVGTFAHMIFPWATDFQMTLFAAGSCAVFVVVNLFTVKGTGRLQVFMVLGLLGILIGYVVFGTPYIRIENYEPFVPRGEPWSMLCMATGMIFVSYIGVTKVAAVGEEVKRPGRNIPFGMLGAFVVVSVLYVLVVAVTVGLGTLSHTERSLTPICDGAGFFFGPAGRVALAIAALLAFVTTANAAVLAASRSLLAMSRDQLVPSFLAGVNRRFQTPHVAILVTGFFMICVILFLSIENLVKTASTLMLLLFGLINISLIAMRASRIHSYRPKFRCPGYPWTQIVAIVTSLFLIAEMGEVPLILSASFILAGLAWYVVYVRARVQRRSAIVHVIERIVDRRFGTSTLEAELKEIVLQRDNITEDRFDRLVKDCTVLDLEASVGYEDFFKLAAEHMAGRLRTSPESLYQQLIEREKESTTVIGPGLAIPHVIIPGENRFDILLARCRQGIVFRETDPRVHVAFVLLGTRDERNFHLKSLMWIAQIVKNPEFEGQWLNAVDAGQLRNIILMATRERE